MCPGNKGFIVNILVITKILSGPVACPVLYIISFDHNPVKLALLQIPLTDQDTMSWDLRAVYPRSPPGMVGVCFCSTLLSLAGRNLKTSPRDINGLIPKQWIEWLCLLLFLL